MSKKLLKYQKPKIVVKKVKISFFLSNIFWLDQYNLVGDVYAQSTAGDAGNAGNAGDPGIAMPGGVPDGPGSGTGDPNPGI